MSGIHFVSQAIKDYYDDTAVADDFRTNGSAAENLATRSLDSRIAAFEQVIIDEVQPGGTTNYDFPYDKEGLRREFLDEVLAMLLMRDSGEYRASVTATVTKIEKTYTWNDDESRWDLTSTVQSQHSQSSYTPIADGTLADGSITHPLPANDGTDPPTDFPFIFGPFTRMTTSYRLSTSNSSTVHNSTSSAQNIEVRAGAKNFDDLTRDQKLSLLSSEGQDVFEYYEKLIDDVFAEGESLRSGPNPMQTAVVSAIPPVALVIGGVTYHFDHVTTIMVPKPLPLDDPDEDPFNYVTHLIQTGTLSTSSTTKTAILNTDGKAVRFEVGLALDDVTVATTKLLPVTYDKATATYTAVIPNGQTSASAPTAVTGLHMMTPDEYLYFWNEARTQILRGQLAYKEAVTREMQEDLRQANDALAELERLAAGAKAPGGNTGSDTVKESLKLDLWEAMVGKPGDKVFNSDDNNDIHSYAGWQENRTNMKNYIDRKSAQSQQAMLDYQTILNRYNNAFEVMSKLQEKIDSLLKNQLRNYN